ncbi:YceI family protein [Paraburkholderia phenazinium]|jgi:polyisoprenoid-binding protein YceI|uniref:Polyisoprenoid-binding protein YceI n=1 Tax=Paraburkholderia phenazinium TaxID=60549 RepID=A0A1G8CQH8_9BURK|nr:YceI family protein [Paraburkholderia phenazinium]SDH47150.1 Polyisoprenoid-binding protein YceI [Paraburkholderia phenazinium]
MKVSFYRYMLAAFAAASLSAAGSALAQVDVTKSTITATSKQMNVPVEGKFNKFSADVKFDAAKPADGSAQFSVEVGSYDLGDESYNDQVRGKDWFDAKTFPQATFVSSAIAPAGSNQFKVTGKLTIKGKSQTVVVPVSVTQQGASQAFDGSLTIKRSQFDIGTGEWKDTSVVADDVIIKFHIVAARK